MSRKTTAIVLSLFLFVPAVAAGDSLADYLPADGYFLYGSVGDASKFVEGARGSAYGKIASHAGFQAFAKELRRILGGELPRGPREVLTGLFDEARRGSLGEISFALLTPTGTDKQPRFIILGEGKYGVIDRIFEKVAGDGKPATGAVTEFQPRVWSAARDGRRVVTNLKGFCEGWLAKKGPRNPLSGSLKADEGSLALRLDVANLFNAIRKTTKLEQEVEQILDLTGIRALRSVQCGFRFTAEGYALTLDVTVPKAERRGLLAMEGGPIPANLPRAIPAGASSWSISTFKLEGLTSRVKAIAKIVDPGIERTIGKLLDKAKVDPDRDIFARLSGVAVSYRMTPELGGLYSDSIAVLPAKDAAQAAESLVKLLSAIPQVSAFPLQFDGRTIHVIQVDIKRMKYREPYFMLLPLFQVLGLPTACAVDGDNLVFGSSAFALKRHFRRMKNGPLLPATKTGNYSAVSWSDTRSNFGSLYNTLLPFVDFGYPLLKSTGQVRRRVTAAACQASLRNMGQTLKEYESDYGAPPRYKGMEFFDTLIGKGKLKKLYHDGPIQCLAAPGTGKGWRGYQTWAGGTIEKWSYQSHSGLPVLWCSAPRHDGGRHVLTAWGGTEWYAERRFQTLLAAAAGRSGLTAPKLATESDAVVAPRLRFDPSMLPVAEEFGEHLHPGTSKAWSDEAGMHLVLRNDLSAAGGGGAATIGLVGAVAAIALPGLLRAKTAANEGSAIGSLRMLATAQEEFRQGAIVDQDGDGQGEYGLLQELAATAVARGGTVKVKPAYISRVFGETAAQNGGIAVRSGYCFLVYLPSSKGTIRESDKAPANDPASANGQELRYIIYAWPLEYGKTGKRAFVVNQQGEVLASNNDTTRYSGFKTIPQADAAFDKAKSSDAKRIDGPLGEGKSSDGGEWRTPGHR